MKSLPSTRLMKSATLNKWTLAAYSLLIHAQVWADDNFASADGKACKFINNITLVLNLVSISVVTIAIIFAGYQIAFAHKRIADVAPILIGGMLIGAAGQIAKMLVGDEQKKSCAEHATNVLLQYTMQFFG